MSRTNRDGVLTRFGKAQGGEMGNVVQNCTCEDGKGRDSSRVRVMEVSRTKRDRVLMRFVRAQRGEMWLIV